MSRRMSRVLASAGVLAAVAGTVAVAAAPAQAAALHTNGHIAWPTNSAGWSVADADGSHVVTVAPTGGGFDAADRVSEVVYSPDGTKVAFAVITAATSNHRDASELWVADASGANAHRVLTASILHDLAWSPDGKKLYFVQSGDHGSQVEVVNVDGSGLAPLPGQTGCDSRSPSVAPNGQVAFAQTCSSSPSPRPVFLDPGATTLRTRLGYHPDNLAFSPDGKWIAYSSFMDGPLNGLYIIPTNGGTRVKISSTLFFGNLAWSPDGSSLLAWSRAANNANDPAVLYKIAAKENAPLVPVAKMTGPDTGYQASWQIGASTAPARPVTDRIGGADRIDTAVRASQWSFDAVGTGGRQAASAVITRSDTFADALAGNALAAEKDGPLFMTNTTSLDPRVKDELLRILPRGANVYVLGGTRALSTAIDTQLESLGFTVTRLAGDGRAYADDRYGTAQAVADSITGYTAVSGGRPVLNAPTSIFVATGDNYPDALAAGAAAAQDPAGTGVVMLSSGSALAPWTQAYLAKLDPKKTRVYTVGGQATAAVAKAFPGWKDLTTPLAGADRYQTAYQVAKSGVFGTSFTEVGIATADNWPDALSGGALIGLRNGPLLLAGKSGLSAQELSVLKTPGLGGIAVFGGAAVVSDASLTGAADAAFGAGGWDKGLNRQAPALK